MTVMVTCSVSLDTGAGPIVLELVTEWVVLPPGPLTLTSNLSAMHPRSELVDQCDRPQA